jgi:transaldolase
MGKDYMKPISELKIKIFGDGADLDGMLALRQQPYIKGFTTNPTLMRKSGVSNYEAFARSVVECIPDMPISFEVFADEPDEMIRQARLIADWGSNIYVKIPVMNTKRVLMLDVVTELAKSGIKQNVTAMMTLAQVRDVSAALANGPSSYVSMFAGRIADTGRDPMPMMAAAVEMLVPYPNIEMIWASPRELLNIYHAEATGTHIITVTSDLLKKIALNGMDLDDFSLDTVKMFYDDAVKAGYTL